jgi:hypothetical protein
MCPAHNRDDPGVYPFHDPGDLQCQITVGGEKGGDADQIRLCSSDSLFYVWQFKSEMIIMIEEAIGASIVRGIIPPDILETGRQGNGFTQGRIVGIQNTYFETVLYEYCCKVTKAYGIGPACGLVKILYRRLNEKNLHNIDNKETDLPCSCLWPPSSPTALVERFRGKGMEY